VGEFFFKKKGWEKLRGGRWESRTTLSTPSLKVMWLVLKKIPMLSKCLLYYVCHSSNYNYCIMPYSI